MNQNENNETTTIKSYINECISNMTPECNGYRVMLEQGIEPETIKAFQLGYDDDADRVILPLTFSKNAWSFIDCKTLDQRTSANETDAIFLSDALTHDKPVFVCSTPLDALIMMQNSNKQAYAISLPLGLSTNDQRETLKNFITTNKDRIKAPLIIAYYSDYEDADQPAREKLRSELERMKLQVICSSIDVKNYTENAQDKTSIATLYRLNADQLASDINKDLYSIDQKVNGAKYQALADIQTHSGATFLHDVETLSSNAVTKYIPTGLKGLDDLLDGGLYYGNLFVLGAVSSLGKTTFMLQIADNIARQNKAVMYFSLEMSACQLVSKSLARISFLQNDKRESKCLEAREFTRVEELTTDKQEARKRAIMEYRQFEDNIYFYEGIGDINATTIRSEVDKFVKFTGRVPVIMIDYLQILAPEKGSISDLQMIDKGMVELKRLTRDYNTPLMIISSFNRGNYNNEVSFASFRGSSGIEYSGDVLIGLQPAGVDDMQENADKINAGRYKLTKQNPKRDIDARIIKNRFGVCEKSAPFTFYAHHDYFEDRR